METTDNVRAYFSKRMSHFDFMHLFFNKDKKFFYPLRIRDCLTASDIEEFGNTGAEAFPHQDGGFCFNINILRIYHIEDKWIMFYKKNFFPINTTIAENENEAEGIVVYNTIDDTLASSLPEHASFDGQLSCWSF